MFLDDDNTEKFEFGSHNFYAPQLSLGTYMGYFPWSEFFRSQGFSDPYPALLYIHQEADLLFERVSHVLTSLISRGSWSAVVRLEFVEHPPQVYPQGHLSIVFPYGDDVELEVVDLALWRSCLAEAVLRYVLHEERYDASIQVVSEYGREELTELPKAASESGAFSFRIIRLKEVAQ